jgi:prephenate dehydrogenase
MSPEEHDMVFAAVSHLPHVVAYALVNSIMDMKGDILENGGQGLKDSTRIALSPTEIWRDICELNRKEILESLKIFSSSLSGIIKLIEVSDWNGLEKEFVRAKEARQSIESN